MTSTIPFETPSHVEGQIFSASFAQQQAWILDQLMPESALNILCATVHLTQALSTRTLALSLNALVQRHDVLRTTFQTLEGQLVQVIAPSLTIPLPTINLQAQLAEERESKAQRLASEQVKQRFDLSQGPLVRASLLQLGAKEYILLLSVHRSICDIRSLQLLLGELASIYEALPNDQHSRSSKLPLPLSYAEFAQQQQEWLKGDTAAEQLSYWKLRLDGSPDGLNLPTDRPRQPTPTWQSSTYSLELSKVLSKSVQELSQREGVSLETTLLAALQSLLYRYTGQEDLVIGMTTSGRRQGEERRAIGLFENMLALRASLADDLPLHELLSQIQQVTLEAQAHQELPFEYLVKEMHSSSSLTKNPFFQVLLTLSPPLPSLPSGWTINRINTEPETSHFDLRLEVEERSEGLFAQFKYSCDLFDEATIVRLANHWQKLLEGIVTNPAQTIAKLPLLTEQERHQLLIEWNTPQVEYFQGQCVHELFEAQVERTPAAVAVVCEGKHITYDELNRQANQLAHHLRELGVQPEVPVGICVERSLEIVVGLLGIFKAGGVYVPIDPTYPAERVTFMAEDTGMPVLLTQQHLLAQFTQPHLQLVCLDANWPTISQHPTTNPVQMVKGEHLAYIIYTSGSTGKPKGVLIEHHALATHCGAIIEVQQLSAKDCMLQLNSFTFDASLEQILPPLLVGAQLVLRGPEVWSPADLLQRVKEHQVTIIMGSCDYWHQVISEWAADPEQLSGQRLRLVSAGGDRFPPEAVRLWQQSPLRSAQLFNVYGPTEATIATTVFDIPSHTEPGTSIPIGRRLPNHTIYILDKVGQPVPQGVAGELYIGGQLARGYLNNPDMTAQRFISNPFSQQPQARLYKTGDLVRYLPGGVIEFLGRADHQVKIRGFRIELGEIEAAIKRHPSVHQTLVMAREDAPGLKRLVAYVVPHSGPETSQLVAQLRALLKERLPDYMIPTAFVLLEAFPVNTSGKFDRRALPIPDFADIERQEDFVAPRTPLEEMVANIWVELLGIKQISIYDDFFALGGHSLLAMRLFDRIGQLCGKKLPLSTLFTGATIEHLAKALQEESNAATKTDTRAPLVVVQEGGTKWPFFYLHGEWKGGGLYSRELARHLGPEQPFYLLEPYKFEGLAVPPTFEEMATAHLETMRSIQPEGPYFLSGYCNGALLAYEMARQLHAQGQTVGLLLLMDPDIPGRNKLLRRLVDQICNLLQIGQKKQFEWFLCLQHMCRYLRFAHYRSSANAQLLANIDQSEPGSEDNDASLSSSSFKLKALFPGVEILRQDWDNLYDWQISNYRPDLYSDKITFFWTSEEPWRSKGWQEVMRIKQAEIETYTNPGDHISGRTKYLPVLAQRLRECLSKAQAILLD